LEHLQEYIRACPHPGIEEWFLIQGSYHGLTNNAYSHLDVASGGALFSLNMREAMKLTEKMVSNQGWNNECLQPKKRGMHTINEVDMPSAKMDLLMKKIEERSNFKDHETIQHYALHKPLKLILGATLWDSKTFVFVVSPLEVVWKF
jgi:hypothetical protein